MTALATSDSSYSHSIKGRLCESSILKYQYYLTKNINPVFIDSHCLQSLGLKDTVSYNKKSF